MGHAGSAEGDGAVLTLLGQLIDGPHLPAGAHFDPLALDDVSAQFGLSIV
jgi:hypothetical protein